VWKMILLYYAISLLIIPCLCHNRLLSPLPWSPSPIKEPPCGGGFALTVPQVYWQIGSTVSIHWNVIGDGLGVLNVNLDPAGGTDFRLSLVENVNVTSLGLNIFSLTVPNVTCTGVNNTCSLQVFSTDGWYECSSVSIIPDCKNCITPSVSAPSCVSATNLTYCSKYNNSKVLLNAGFSLQNLDLMVNWTVSNYTQMPIFLNGSLPACHSLYKDYLCSVVFPACDGKAQSCQDTCTSFKSKCGLAASHQGLYNCSSLSACPAAANRDWFEKITLIVGCTVVAVIVAAFLLNFIFCRNKSRAGYAAIQ